MTDERYKKIMADLGMPNSSSLLVALQQVANEAGQECAAAEREACAKVCDAKAVKWEKEADKHLPHHSSDCAKRDMARAAICDADAAAI